MGQKMNYEMEHLYLFLQTAKSEQLCRLRQQWGGEDAKTKGTQVYEKGSFQLTQYFSMEDLFIGQDVVRYQKRPVWMMNYFGNVLEEKERVGPEGILELMRMSLFAVCQVGGLNGWIYRKKEDCLYMVCSYGGSNMYNGKGYIYKENSKLYHYTYYGGIVSD